MKIYTLVFLIALIGIYFTSSAQTEKDSWLIGGNGSCNFSRMSNLSSNQNAFYNQFDASLSPNIGFFLFNNFAVGTSVPVHVTAATDYNSHSIGAGPFVRYYFGRGRIKVFPEMKIEFNRIAYKYEEPLTEFNNTSRTNTYKIGPGAAYFIANNLAIEAILNFYTVTGKYNYSNSPSLIDRQGISFNIGLQFYLPNKR